MERECLLAAVELFDKYAASGHAPSSINLGGLITLLVPRRTTIEIAELPASPPPSAPAALPPPPPVERYVHPELRALQSKGSNSKFVRWAIGRLHHDYTSRDIAALLEREGHLMTSAEISVVLTRFKRSREIEEIRIGTGRTPAVFRKVTNAGPWKRLPPLPSLRAQFRQHSPFGLILPSPHPHRLPRHQTGRHHRRAHQKPREADCSSPRDREKHRFDSR